MSRSILRCLVALVAISTPGPAFSHGLLLEPEPRTTNDSQVRAPSSCGQYPDPGPITGMYTAGEEILIAFEVTISHPPGDWFRFQLCDDPLSLSEACFEAGEFAAVQNLGVEQVYETLVTLPETPCEDCVLRWFWDYGFLSCADIEIHPVPEPHPIPTWAASLLLLRSMARRRPSV